MVPLVRFSDLNTPQSLEFNIEYVFIYELCDLNLSMKFILCDAFVSRGHILVRFLIGIVFLCRVL